MIGRGRGAKATQRIHRAPTDGGEGVVREREEGVRRRVRPQPPAFQQDLAQCRCRIGLRQCYLPSQHRAEKLTSPPAADLGYGGHRFGCGGGIERRKPGQALDQRLERRGVAQQAETKCGRKADSRVRLIQDLQQKRGGAQVSNSASRQRRSAPND
jgi:hypothetical protein